MSHRQTTSGAQRIKEAIRQRTATGEAILAPFITAGFPDPEQFPRVLGEIESVADLVEIGVPFSDPMADGVTIQRSSRAALDAGVHLDWIFSTLEASPSTTPRVLMSYYNPILAYGLDYLATRLRSAGIDALIIPDLPFEEQGEIRSALFDSKIGLIQLVTPITPPARRRSLAEASAGFLYAVTVTGTTGGGASTHQPSPQNSSDDLTGYLKDLTENSPVPVLAGFGVRSHEQLQAIARVAAGAIVGSALIEALEAGIPAAEFLQTLRFGSANAHVEQPLEVSP